MNLKATIVFCIFFSYACLAAHAQDNIRKEKRNVMGISYSGFSTTVPYSEQRTKQYLSNYLKENGRISERRNFIEIKEAYWKSKDSPVKVYALVVGDSTQSRVWIGYSADAGDSLTTAIKGEMESIPFQMHKAHLQQQIKDAEEAASYLSKEIRNSDREGQRLNSRLEENAREKIRLEQALEQNARDKVQLEQDIVNNAEAKEEKTQALDEVKRQLEYLQERLSRL